MVYTSRVILQLFIYKHTEQQTGRINKLVHATNRLNSHWQKRTSAKKHIVRDMPLFFFLHKQINYYFKKIYHLIFSDLEFSLQYNTVYFFHLFIRLLNSVYLCFEKKIWDLYSPCFFIDKLLCSIEQE